MSGQPRLPLQIDPFRMAEVGRKMEGQVELKQFKRLLPVLESEEGVVDVELAFDIDEIGTPYLRGRVEAELVLCCQRCLKRLDYPLHSDFQLAMVHSHSEVEHLPEHYEPLVVETTPLFILDVVEDELLLSVPHIPMHDGAVCTIKQPASKTEFREQQEEEKPNPFAVLEKLKKDH